MGKRTRQLVLRLLISTLFIAGLAMTLWPVAETLTQNYQGAQDLNNYVQQMDKVPAELSKQQRIEGERYNQQLDTHKALKDPWNDEQPATSKEHDQYLKTMSAMGSMGPLGRIRIPKIDVDLPIRHDATKESMKDGAGHMYGTSLPVGGNSTHSVIAAHTGYRRVFFDRMPELVFKDRFYIDTYEGTLVYEVDDIHVVPPEDTSLIKVVPDRDLVTLVTCVPGPQGYVWRLLVRGTRIHPAAPSPSASPSANAPQIPKGSATEPNGFAPAQAATPQPTSSVDPAAVHNPSVDVDLSVQPWMRERLIVGGIGLVFYLMIVASWVHEDRETKRRAIEKQAVEAHRAAVKAKKEGAQ